MRKFVYAPRIEVLIWGQETGPVDVSRHVISATVNLVQDEASTASVLLQNKFGLYLKKFKPMDRIVIRATRVKTFPIFLGYLDDTPFYQMYPGPVRIQATDVIKLLQNMYFDPALPSVMEIFRKHELHYDPITGHAIWHDSFNTYGNKMKGVIKDVLTEVALFPEDAVIIQDIPINAWSQFDSDLKKQARLIRQKAMDLKEIRAFGQGDMPGLTRLDSAAPGYSPSGSSSATGTSGSGSGSTSSSSNIDTSSWGQVLTSDQLAKLICSTGFSTEIPTGWNHSPAEIAFAVAMAESGGDTKAVNTAGNNPPSRDRGLFQINDYYHSEVSDECAFNPVCNAKEAYRISNGGKSWGQWATYNNGLYIPYLDDARRAINKNCKGQGSNTTSPRLANIPSPTERIVSVHIGQSQTLTSIPISGRIAAPANPEQPQSGGAIHGPIAIAQSQIGTCEDPPGSNSGAAIRKYQAVTGAYNAPWCGSFLAWVFLEAGYGDKVPQGAADVSTWNSLYQKNNSVSHCDAKPGDIITFDYDQSINSDEDHIALVINNSNGTIAYIGGNQGSNGCVSYNTISCNSRSIRSILRIPGVDPGQPGPLPPGVGSGSGGTGGGGGSGVINASLASKLIVDGKLLTTDDIDDIALQAGYSTLSFINGDYQKAYHLTGEYAPANDVSILAWLQDAVKASGRVFQSTPYGHFFAYFPDYFGLVDSTPHFKIRAIEMIDLNIQLSDRPLVTHIFAVGNLTTPHGVTLIDELNPALASIYKDEFKALLANSKSFDPEQFIGKYGLRPKYIEMPHIRHPGLLTMKAWMELMLAWSELFHAEASFTFMPELFPGTIVNLDDKVIMYVTDVSHNFDLSSGFTTTCSLKAPSCPPGGNIDDCTDGFFSLIKGGFGDIAWEDNSPPYEGGGRSEVYS